MDQIVLANPGNASWNVTSSSLRRGRRGDRIDGFTIDTYGYPRFAFDADGNAIDMRRAYESFLRFARNAWPDVLISFNQVNGVPSGARPRPGPRFPLLRICPPNERNGVTLKDCWTRSGVLGACSVWR